MAIRSTFTTGEVLTAADLTDTIKGAFINTETTTARTLGTADAGNLVTLNNNSGGTVTIPTNTTWGSPLGTLVHLINIGTAGSFTVGTAAGVTLNAASATLAIQEGGTLIKTATNTWQFVKGGGLPKALSVSSTTGSPTVTTYTENSVNYTAYLWTGNGSITPASTGYCDILCIAGGGGGGDNIGGGGGAGGLVIGSFVLNGGQAYTITVGGGGPGNSANGSGTTGSDSTVVGVITAKGGGGGGASANGSTGGSGGGGGAANLATTGGAATERSGRAGAGSESVSAGSRIGGGGGGLGSLPTNRDGGRGITSGITGTLVQSCGGGGGGVQNSGNGLSVAYDGGGAGARANTNTAVAGSANTGGGGGGGTDAGGYDGANGGSGRVVIRIRTN